MREFDVRDALAVTGARTDAASGRAALGDTQKNIGSKLTGSENDS
jgi:hypothetical protein